MSSASRARRFGALAIALAAAFASLTSAPAADAASFAPVRPAAEAERTTSPLREDKVADDDVEVLSVSLDEAGAARSVDDLTESVEALGGTVRYVDEASTSVTVEVPTERAREGVAELSQLDAVDRVERPTRVFLHAVPNDPLYDRQRRPYEQISLPEAWDRGKGSRDVTIAIIDTGVEFYHPDLDGKVIAGYDAVYGGTYVDDHHGHGTMVAGIAAAQTDNKRGVAGVGWNTRLLVAKVDDNYGNLYTDAIARGIRWAADRGADVINLSLGTARSDYRIADAVGYAQRRGSIVVASAGNDGTSQYTYPAALPGVVAVGATRGSSRASFSQHGSWVDVAAPGVNIRTTSIYGGYQDFSGTSASAPVVSGQIALLRAAKPQASNDRITSIVRSSASGVASSWFGNGRIDVRASMDMLLGSRPGAPRGTAARPGDGRITVSWRAPANGTGGRVASYAIELRPAGGTWKAAASAGRAARQVTVKGLRNGRTYQVRVRAANRFGTGRPSASAAVIVGVPSAARSVRGAGTAAIAATRERPRTL